MFNDLIIIINHFETKFEKYIGRRFGIYQIKKDRHFIRSFLFKNAVNPSQPFLDLLADQGFSSILRQAHTLSTEVSKASQK